MYNQNLKGEDDTMEKKLVFNQADFMYTMVGASVLTGFLFIFTQMWGMVTTWQVIHKRQSTKID